MKGKDMKPFLYLGSVLAAAAASVLFGPVGLADTPPAPSFTIENHQKLVTVKDSNGVWLYAQVISSPDVKIVDVPLGKNLSRLSLQDASGKTLWSKTLSQAFNDVDFNGSWDEALKTIPDTLEKACESLGWKKAATSERSSFDRIEVIVGPDGRAVSFGGEIGFRNIKHQFVATLLKNGVAIRMAPKYFLVILSPPATPQTAPVTAQASAH
jgi:hypothetical protein